MDIREGRDIHKDRKHGKDGKGEHGVRLQLRSVFELMGREMG